VRDPRQDRDLAALHRRLRAVEDLGEEGVADPAQPEHLDDEVEPRAELVALAAVEGRGGRVGPHGGLEAGELRPDRAHDLPPLVVCSGNAHGAGQSIHWPAVSA
jgi:hypothetical protein